MHTQRYKHKGNTHAKACVVRFGQTRVITNQHVHSLSKNITNAHTHIHTHLKLQTQSGRIHQDSVLHCLAVGQNSAQRLRRWFCTLTLGREVCGEREDHKTTIQSIRQPYRAEEPKKAMSLRSTFTIFGF